MMDSKHTDISHLEQECYVEYEQKVDFELSKEYQLLCYYERVKQCNTTDVAIVGTKPNVSGSLSDIPKAHLPVSAAPKRRLG